ncbi:hypothetical protein EHEL_040615 [Encephalitozoon hellem ATCC 50504]|uniref:Uncharacterized protein n=1 Tax=Encephalitozoon hellem TaxID=27973 RepID=A0A9Q9C2M8_ENCHE|nr:uncharacterized protein EHEL_040615 [Encephalitozoon hellem ATCC 50504]AHL28920.1 hypothetical protein EHEL_040615 [Encephalitozoon hellem ATCC 50504]UTX42956.1 hypothetical protein GPU96_04g06880 [Encephalitozoon hellem]WEL38413.1 hypothetical protein PFJ87_04g00860 [Encephalitozoon hellem]
MRRWFLLVIGIYGVDIKHPPAQVVNNVLDDWSKDFEKYVDDSLKAGRKRQGIVLYSSSCSGKDCKSRKVGCSEGFCKGRLDKF